MDLSRFADAFARQIIEKRLISFDDTSRVDCIALNLFNLDCDAVEHVVRG